MRIIAADVHALDRGSTGVRAFVLQMDDKGVYFAAVIINFKLIVFLGIAYVTEGFFIVVDRNFNTGVISSKRLVVCVCKGQVIADLLLQLEAIP